MRGREGRREGGEREGERELCDLVIRESILGEQEIEAANEKREERKTTGEQEEETIPHSKKVLLCQPMCRHDQHM